MKDYCFVKVGQRYQQVDEFFKGAPAHHSNHLVYLVWKWEWISLLACAKDFAQPMSDVSEEEQIKKSLIINTLYYLKCIGATRDCKQQSALEKQINLCEQIRMSGLHCFLSQEIQ